MDIALEILRELVGLIKGVAWPIIVLIGIFVLKGDISHVLRHAKIRASKDSIEYDVGNVAQAAEKESSPFENIPENPNPLIAKYEQQVREQLAVARSTLRLADDVILARALAEQNIVVAFERTYRLIWGAQIALIKRLNELGGSAPLEIIKHYYDLGKSQFPQIYENYTFNDWQQFLVRSDLITVSDGRVVLTLEGREFYPYIVRRGYSQTPGG